MRKFLSNAAAVMLLIQIPAAQGAATQPSGFKALAEAGSYAYQRGDFKAAEVSFTQAVAAADKLSGKQAQLAKSIALTNLGASELALDKLEDAERNYRASLEIKESIVGKNDDTVADTLQHLAACLRRQKRTAEADELELRAEMIQLQKAAKDIKPSISLNANPNPNHAAVLQEMANAQSTGQAASAEEEEQQIQITRIIAQSANDKEQLWNPRTREVPTWRGNEISGIRTEATGQQSTLDFIRELSYLEARYQLAPSVADDAVKTIHDGGSVVELSNGWLLLCSRELHPRIWRHGLNVRVQARHVSSHSLYVVRSGAQEFVGRLIAEK